MCLVDKIANDQTPQKELRFIAQIKNNRLLRIREEMKMNQSEFAKLLGVTNTFYGRMENLKFYPLIKNDTEWSESATKIAKKLRLPEDYIWPEALKTIEKTKIEMELDAKELLALTSAATTTTPDDYLRQVDLRIAVNKMLATLEPREEKIIRLRFGMSKEDVDDGERTLEEIGDMLNVTSGRIQAIEKCIFRKLMCPSRVKKVLEFVNPDLTQFDYEERVRKEKKDRGYIGW